MIKSLKKNKKTAQKHKLKFTFKICKKALFFRKNSKKTEKVLKNPKKIEKNAQNCEKSWENSTLSEKFGGNVGCWLEKIPNCHFSL